MSLGRCLSMSAYIGSVKPELHPLLTGFDVCAGSRRKVRCDRRCEQGDQVDVRGVVDVDAVVMVVIGSMAGGP